jgi:Tfp pilus assembly protein PilV
MSAPKLTSSIAAAKRDDGLTLIEVLIASFVLTVGVIGMILAFDSARKLSLRSERRTALAHRAQLELERLQSMPYAQLAMISAPTHSTEASNPDYYATSSSYQFGESGTESESLVLAAKAVECATTTETECGVVASSPSSRLCTQKVGACEWVDGNVTGRLYDFITWHTDKNCGAGCPSKENYKRLSVVATATATSSAPAAVRVSTLVAEAQG